MSLRRDDLMGSVALAMSSSSGMMVTSEEFSVLVVGRLVEVEDDGLIPLSMVGVLSSLGITFGWVGVVVVLEVADEAAACRGST